MNKRKPKRQRNAWQTFAFLLKYALEKEATTKLGRANIVLTAIVALVAIVSNSFFGSLELDATPERTVITVTGGDMAFGLLVTVLAFIVCLFVVGGVDYMKHVRRK